MSCGYVTSYLFATFKDKKLYEKFETMFNESEHCEEFRLIGGWTSEPNRVFFEFASDKLKHYEDAYVIDLDKWLFENFKIHLEGYWIIESNDVCRCELHHGEIFSVDCDWLRHDYTVEQIEKLKKIAEELDK